MLNPRTPKSQCFSAPVNKSDVRGLIFLFSSIGANALQVTLTLNFGGKGFLPDRRGLNISSIYGSKPLVTPQCYHKWVLMNHQNIGVFLLWLYSHYRRIPCHCHSPDSDSRAEWAESWSWNLIPELDDVTCNNWTGKSKHVNIWKVQNDFIRLIPTSWHSIWHIFWHSNSICHIYISYSDILSFWHSILTFHLSFYLACVRVRVPRLIRSSP